MNDGRGQWFADPPRWAEALLRRLASGPSVRFVVGDLREEYRRLRKRRCAIRAVPWYWGQAVAIGARLAWRARRVRAADGGSVVKTRETAEGGSVVKTGETAEGGSVVKAAEVAKGDAGKQLSGRLRARRQPGETMSNLLQDVKMAFRTWWRSPLFTTVALLTLGLGIGANTAVFTIVNGVVLRPLPYEDPDGLVSVWMQEIGGDATDAFSLAEYLDLGEQAATLGEVGYWTWWSMDITDASEPIRVQSARVSVNMLDILGVEPREGRFFRPEEGEPGNDHVALVSHSLWQGHYGGNPTLVGSEVEIDGAPHTVVGIMPEGFRFPYEAQYGMGFWTPMTLDAQQESRFSRWLNVVGRLGDGVSIEQQPPRLRPSPPALPRNTRNRTPVG